MKIIAKNKKAYFDYEILEEFEAGMQLTGSEIKSIRDGKVQLKGSYVIETTKGLATKNIHISPWKLSAEIQEATRQRNLLLHKKEIEKIKSKMQEQGLTVIPLKLYLKNGYAKLTIGIAKGKKQHDKRNLLKQKSQDLEVKRALKNY